MRKIIITFLSIFLILGLISCGESEQIPTKTVTFNNVTLQIPENYKLDESLSSDNFQYYDLKNKNGDVEKRIILSATDEDLSLNNSDYNQYLDEYMDGFKTSDYTRDFSEITEENFAGVPAKSISFRMDISGSAYYGKLYALYLNHRVITIGYLSLSSSMADFVSLIDSIITEDLEATEDLETAESVEPTTTKASIPPGTYKVGTDIEAGEYKLTATGTSMGYYAVLNSSDPFDIASNNNFENQSYVTVNDGQYLELSFCTGEKVE